MGTWYKCDEKVYLLRSDDRVLLRLRLVLWQFSGRGGYRQYDYQRLQDWRFSGSFVIAPAVLTEIVGS